MALEMEEEESEDNTEEGMRGGTLHSPAMEQAEET
jgi:hypothetical protein